MTFPRQGEVFAVVLPGRAGNKPGRPAVVMRPDYRNEFANDVLVIPLTTTLRAMPTHVAMPAGAGGLAKPSMAKAEQITALPKSFLLRGPLGGRIPIGKLRELQRAVWLAIGGEDIDQE